MSSQPARHRCVGAADPTGFWAAREILDAAAGAGRARHARRTPARFPAHVGRVGALAVSLGIGIAIANAATGVASAEGESDSGSVSAPASPGATAPTTGGDTSDGGAVGDPGAHESGAAGNDDGHESGAAAEDEAAAEAADDEAAAEAGDDEAAAEAGDEDAVDEATDDEAGDNGYPTPETGQPEAAIDSDDEPGPLADAAGVEQVVTTGSVTQARIAPSKPLVSTLQTAAPVAHEAPVETASVDLLNAAVATVVAPLADSALPAPSPVADGVLTWLRRLITHTFFNKTPVVRSVQTEQLLTGQVVVRIDAVDPNGDPLTYDIVQPANGLVFREPLTGAFIYTPTVPVLGNPVPVRFDVVIRDDSEHLTGVLGSIQNLLHSVARIFGLAQRDNYTQTVTFNAEPIVQTPPTLAVLGGLPYLLGGSPVSLLSVATIVDVDSPSMREATVSIGVGRQSGDKLRYVAPDGVTIGVEQINEYTIALTGVASQADYERALTAITFSTTDLGLVARTVDITIKDEQGVPNVVPVVAAVTVLPGLPLGAPSILAVGGLPYFLGGNAVSLLSVADITDLDSDSLKRARITISDLTRAAGDRLSYVAPAGNGVGVAQINDWTIELTGVHTVEDYETALKAITFSATQLGLLARTVEITLTDADDVDSALPALVAVTVLPGLDVEAPLIVTPIGLPVHTIGKAPVKLLSSVAIANADDGKLSGAVVTIGLNRASGDKLGFTAVAGNPVTVTQTNDWTITLSGTGTVEQYQQALQSLTFSATALGLPRTVTISVTEGDGDTSPAPGIVFANSIAPLRPTILTPALPATHTLGKAGTVLTPVVVIEDVDSPVLTGATVALGAGRQAGDKLTFSPAAGSPISASWNGTDTLTLSGTASVAQYAAALQAVTFSATGGAGVLRAVSINVVDDSGLTALIPGVATALVKNPDRPTVVTVGLSALSFPSVGQTVKPITVATIVDTDSTVLTAASVKITDRYISGDTLSYAPIVGVPITATYDTTTGELALTGTATIAQYKLALESVTFKATRYGGALLDVLGVTRTISVYVTDDSAVSNALPGVVAVTVFR